MKPDIDHDLEFADERVRRHFSPASLRRLRDAYKKRREQGTTTRPLSLRTASLLLTAALDGNNDPAA